VAPWPPAATFLEAAPRANEAFPARSRVAAITGASGVVLIRATKGL
jgi:hypothetical protein